MIWCYVCVCLRWLWSWTFLPCLHPYNRSQFPCVGSNTRQTRRMTVVPSEPPPPPLRSQSSLRPQLGLPATPGLGPQQRLHLARIGRGPPSPGPPSGPDGGREAEALSRSRLDWVNRQHVGLGLFQHASFSHLPTYLASASHFLRTLDQPHITQSCTTKWLFDVSIDFSKILVWI